MDEADAQRQPYWPELEELARPAREHRRLAPEIRSQIILKLCRRAPLSVKELSILLNRSEAYVGDAIRPLVTAGELTFLYPDQPRHPRQKYVARKQIDGASEEQRMPEPEPRHELPRDVIDAPPAYYEPRVQTRSEPQTVSVIPDDNRHNLPNQWTNLLAVVVLGVLLGMTSFALWWLVALAGAVGLSWLHVVRDTAQYRKFVELAVMPSRVHGFMLLKSTVAFLEIFLVYAVVRAVAGGA